MRYYYSIKQELSLVGKDISQQTLGPPCHDCNRDHTE